MQKDIFDQAEFSLIVADDLKVMHAGLFAEAPIGLKLPQKPILKLGRAHV
jgi:acyl CoA:acetate/3-ketoacid CoA transferase